MRTRTILSVVCVAGLLTACSQKQSVVSVPVSKLDVESLNKQLDLNMDVSALSVSDLRVLRNAPAARQGYPFKDAYLRGIYQGTTWYDSLMNNFDASLDFSNAEARPNEDERSLYYRVANDGGYVKYSDEELAFMKRVKEREDELMKQNFDVEAPLRVNVQNLINSSQLKEFDQQLCDQLAQNGFSIVPAQHDQLFHVYEQNDYTSFPSFVTTDLFLQLYHLYFDSMLRELEEHSLIDLMNTFSQEMYRTMSRELAAAEPGSLEAKLLEHNKVFFSVACHLFTDQAVDPNESATLAAEEIEKVMSSQDNMSNFMADYRNVSFAYSLFRPRGHYTRSEALKRYFRGMMWLQSVPFGLDHVEELQEAVLMAEALKNNPQAMQKYKRLDKFITFLMGQSDNLSIPQVMAEMEKMNMPVAQLLRDEQALKQLKERLGTIGEKQTRIRPKYENTSHNKVCLMPQRYQPDAEVLLNMVDYDSKPSLRPVPKGLDFFAAMGVSAAEQILMEEGQEWKDFKNMLTSMKGRMKEIDWNETTATQWMQTLKVIADKDEKHPYFMVTPEWAKKNLNAMLASWAELKHDAILYAKQPMGAECGGGGLPAPVVKGYVEPNVKFWKKAIELLDNTKALLKQEGMLTEKIDEISERIREEAQFLLRVSEKELAGKPLTDEEYDQIKCMGATFENISLDLVREPNQYLMGWSDVEGADRKVALVADVYTANANNNPNKCILFEAVGDADEIFVIVEIEGYLYLTRGAVLSYREFIQDMGKQRLTDEEWQKQLESDPRKAVPEWMNSIIVPLKTTPKVNEEYFYSSGC